METEKMIKSRAQVRRISDQNDVSDEISKITCLLADVFDKNVPSKLVRQFIEVLICDLERKSEARKVEVTLFCQQCGDELKNFFFVLKGLNVVLCCEKCSSFDEKKFNVLRLPTELVLVLAKKKE